MTVKPKRPKYRRRIIIPVELVDGPICEPARATMFCEGPVSDPSERSGPIWDRRGIIDNRPLSEILAEGNFDQYDED